MPTRPNGQLEDQQRPVDPFSFFQAAISFQQEILKAGLISTETMRLASDQFRRQFEHLSMVGQTFMSISKSNTEFLQEMAAESGENLKRTASLTAAWADKVGENRTQ